MSDLPEGWVETNLVSCLEKIIDYRGKTPKKSDSGILTLSAKSVKMGKIDYSQAYYISQETYDKFMVRGFPKKGDVLMTTEAPLGCIAKLDRDDVSVAQRLLTLRGKEGVLDNDYLMFYLTSRRGQYELQSRASGSTVQGIKRSEFEHVQIVLPPFPEQKAIADMLSSFDEKIELLREQNKTLETLAQTIFKEWFVHFNYPAPQPPEGGVSSKSPSGDLGAMIESELGLIPQGWRAGSLLEVFDLIGGGTPKTSVDEYWNGDILWYSVVDAPKGSDTFVIDTEKKISDLGLQKSSTKLLRKGTTIVSARGTVGKLALVGCETAMNQSCYGIQGKDYFGDYYVYYQVKQALDDLKRNVHGAVFDTITQATFQHIEVPIPDMGITGNFERLVEPIMDKILNNVFQIQTLSKTRDTLLPKLMSGKVRVN